MIIFKCDIRLLWRSNFIISFRNEEDYNCDCKYYISLMYDKLEEK